MPRPDPKIGPAALYVVGLGPGEMAYLAPAALDRLQKSTAIAGYRGYLALLPEELKTGKELISTGMRGEVSRVDQALQSALSGRETCLVCSGDPGIYAMAGLVLERLEKLGPAARDLPVEIVPGIPALCAAASLLGAPLMHDFACVSLSDLLTPWETIARRLEAALAGDFVLVLYNPRSRQRLRQLEEALRVSRSCRGPETPVGIVRNAFRTGQRCAIVSLSEVDPEKIDMFTLIIIGNSQTRVLPGKGGDLPAWESGARMLTPRGYESKQD